MSENSSIKLTIAFNDTDLDNEDLEEQDHNLLAQVRDLDEIETVDRVLDLNLPEGNKAVCAVLVGLLRVKMSKENVQKVMGFLGNSASDRKPILIF